MIVLSKKYNELPIRASYLNQVFKDYINSCSNEVEIQTIREMCDEARSYGLWIYDGNNKGWSSPDTFADGIWNYRRTATAYYDKIEFKDPLEGLTAGHKALNIEISRLIKRMDGADISILKQLDLIRYYQLKLSELTKNVIEYDRRAW